jgi:hypothetical protein
MGSAEDSAGRPVPSSAQESSHQDGVSINVPQGQGHTERDTQSIWNKFEHEQERCRACFSKLTELPEWSAGPWHDIYNEALQARIKRGKTFRARNAAVVSCLLCD